MNITQIEYSSRDVGCTQCKRILAVLLARSPEWVSQPELARAATETGIGVPVHSRVSEIRTKLGYDVQHQNRWKGRQCHSFYRLPSRLP